MTLYITLPRALELLNEAVEERGFDYIDPGVNGGGCSYVIDGKPGCIVGLVLHKAGVPIEVLQAMDSKGSLSCMGWSFLRDTFDIDIESTAFAALSVAQRNQDDGAAWGTAVSRAGARVRA